MKKKTRGRPKLKDPRKTALTLSLSDKEKKRANRVSKVLKLNRSEMFRVLLEEKEAQLGLKSA